MSVSQTCPPPHHPPPTQTPTKTQSDLRRSEKVSLPQATAHVQNEVTWHGDRSWWVDVPYLCACGVERGNKCNAWGRGVVCFHPQTWGNPSKETDFKTPRLPGKSECKQPWNNQRHQHLSPQLFPFWLVRGPLWAGTELQAMGPGSFSSKQSPPGLCVLSLFKKKTEHKTKQA